MPKYNLLTSNHGEPQVKKASQASGPQAADYSKSEIKPRKKAGTENEEKQTETLQSQELCCFINADELNSINSLQDVTVMVNKS